MVVFSSDMACIGGFEASGSWVLVPNACSYETLRGVATILRIEECRTGLLHASTILSTDITGRQFMKASRAKGRWLFPLFRMLWSQRLVGWFSCTKVQMFRSSSSLIIPARSWPPDLCVERHYDLYTWLGRSVRFEQRWAASLSDSVGHCKPDGDLLGRQFSSRRSNQPISRVYSFFFCRITNRRCVGIPTRMSLRKGPSICNWILNGKARGNGKEHKR